MKILSNSGILLKKISNYHYSEERNYFFSHQCKSTSVNWISIGYLLDFVAWTSLSKWSKLLVTFVLNYILHSNQLLTTAHGNHLRYKLSQFNQLRKLPLINYWHWFRRLTVYFNLLKCHCNFEAQHITARITSIWE